MAQNCAYEFAGRFNMPKLKIFAKNCPKNCQKFPMHSDIMEIGF